jgi:hypothetical protein
MLLFLLTIDEIWHNQKKYGIKNSGFYVMFRGFAGGKHAYVEMLKGEYL